MINGWNYLESEPQVHEGYTMKASIDHDKQGIPVESIQKEFHIVFITFTR
jgi:hypothetical protein